MMHTLGQCVYNFTVALFWLCNSLHYVLLGWVKTWIEQEQPLFRRYRTGFKSLGCKVSTLLGTWKLHRKLEMIFKPSSLRLRKKFCTFQIGPSPVGLHLYWWWNSFLNHYILYITSFFYTKVVIDVLDQRMKDSTVTKQN